MTLTFLRRLDIVTIIVTVQNHEELSIIKNIFEEFLVIGNCETTFAL